MGNSNKHQRFHGLDAFRASMMLLGLVFHSSVSYTHIPLSASWPFRDNQGNYLFDVLVYGLHLFRMPAFFVIAGFFAALVYYKRGLTSMLNNRFKRVTLPLLVLWIFVVPTTYAGFIYATNIQERNVLDIVIKYLLSGEYFFNKELAHLWFLYHLTIFYLAMVVILFVINQLPNNFRQALMNIIRKLIRNPFGIIIMIVITSTTLLPMGHPGLETNTNLTPPIRGLIAYSIFFLYGWILYNCYELLEVFCKRTWPHIFTGMLFTSLYCGLILLDPLENEKITHLSGIIIGSTGIWSLIYGLLGIYCRYFDNPSPLARYFSDASYWMYLIHVPIIIVIAGTILPYTLNPVLKFLIVYVITNLVCIITYDLFVRSSFIGLFLNGKRNPRVLTKS